VGVKIPQSCNSDIPSAKTLQKNLLNSNEYDVALDEIWPKWKQGGIRGSERSEIMITVTENAKKHLAQVLQDATAPRRKALRLMLVADSARMILDEHESDDVIISFKDRPVLLLDPDVAKVLQHRTLDAGDRGELFFRKDS
jgi:hypothetical protein